MELLASSDFSGCLEQSYCPVGGDDGEPGATAEMRLQKIGDAATKVVVPNSCTRRRIWHNLASMMPERAGEFKPIDSPDSA